MEPITYEQIHELIRQLPDSKLSIAYQLLKNLIKTDKPENKISPQELFMQLPLEERRRLLAQHAQKMVSHYKETTEKRQIWQFGDFFDDY